MALATQCPHCYTSFRVANDQLKLHAGMVRCGACKQTFNGIEHLLEPGEAPRTPPVEAKEPVIHAEVKSEPLNSHPSFKDDQVQQEALAPEADIPSTVEVDEVEFDHQLASTESDADFTPEAVESRSVNDSSHDAPSHFDVAKEVSLPSNEAEDREQTQQGITEETHENSSTLEDRTPNQQELDDIALFQEKLASFAPQIEENVEDPLEDSPTQQELDDIALFQQKLASFAPQMESITDSATEPVKSDDQLTAEIASTQLEIVEQQTTIAQETADNKELSENSNETELTETPKNAHSLTASLDFELNDEEKSWTEPDLVSKIEIQTQAAITDGDDSKYSRHEPVFSDDTILEDDLEQDLHQLLAETKKTEVKLETDTIAGTPDNFVRQEPNISTKDPEPVLENAIDEDDVQPEFMLQAEKAKRYSKVQLFSLWLSVICLFLIASAQGIYFFRSGIAAHFPQSKPLIQQMCQKLSCQIKLPTQIDHIVFDSTELLTLNQDPHILSLSLQLQNKSATTQAWPMLELTLKDSRGKTVLQRVFTPEEYLENKAMVTKGFAANSDTNIKVHFELTTMKAANYAVGVFYP